MKKVAIIGGGPAGIMSALTLSEFHDKITIFEGNNRVGKKILVTGNGKCNLGNLELTSDCYHSSNQNIVEHCLTQFNAKDTINFFTKNGLLIREKNQYLYPESEQAASVLDRLRFSLKTENISIHLDTKIYEIKLLATHQFQITYDNKIEIFDFVILATGSKAAPKTGSDGSGYQIAKKLKHTINPVMPALVQLRCTNTYCKALAGIRAQGKLMLYKNKQMIANEIGEIQLTDYGISGIPVFQISGFVNRLLFTGNKVSIKIDFFPNYTYEQLEDFLGNRLITRKESQLTVEEFLTGMIPKKLLLVALKECHLTYTKLICNISLIELMKIINFLKEVPFDVKESNSFDQAQICTGGIDLNEVTPNLESIFCPNLFFAGEILDVDGRCGGYNLQWAWTSGFMVGTEIKKRME